MSNDAQKAVLHRYRLLFHHHAPVYQDQTGSLWLHSGIGRWINALAPYFSCVDLLLHQTAERKPKQDTQISGDNIHLVSLGDPGYLGDWFSRRGRIGKICEQAGENADALLIRGITPRQMLVWRKAGVAKKAFLMVRSPRQERIMGFSFWRLVSFGLNRAREHQFARIARSDTVIMTNSKIHLPEIEKIAKKPAFYVPTNTIRADEIPDLEIRTLNDPIRLLYVGRLQYLKGLRELLAAVAELKAGGTPVELHMAAGLEEPIFSELQHLAANLGIDQQVQWHGFVPFGEPLFAHYRSVDIFVLPSYTEGFPRVFWEAAANSCPAVISNVGGIPALLEDEVHALLIPPKDVGAIVDAVRRLAADEALRKRIAAHAHRLALDYTVESCAEKLVKVLGREWAGDDD